ncbi:hypothetical protein F0231_20445 [Vibrio sp. RE86]|uniref:hypothetical protein n=1 Tax=Vibrio sp. RE86 TaxID=2607605 RepID=UPI001493934C|nr:hypothetical protein [Vibrio sp. RE86]NOH82088.1 hypothetical protein [Vibrio sp. RE86]
MSEELKEFRASIDIDQGFQSKRRMLMMACMTFLALNLSGATLEEANTFLFKIKFNNYIGLSYLFLLSIVFLTLRYYSYAQDYHSRLYEFWTKRMLSDHRVFFYDSFDDEISGLLSKSISVWVGDEPGLTEPSYKVSGLFKRTLSYRSEDIDEERGPYYYTEYIDLYKVTDSWNRKHYCILLWFELKYQIESIFKYRESLDLLAPYLLSVVSILSFVFKSEILSWLPTT